MSDQNQNSPTLQEIQTQVDDWVQDIGVRYFNEMTNLGQLMEEVGEIARLMTRTYGEQSFKKGKKPENVKQELADEISDVMFVLVCIANQTGIDLTQAFKKNMDKKNTRDKNRHKENKKLAG